MSGATRGSEADVGQSQVNPVLDVDDVRQILRVRGEEKVRNWIRTFAGSSILPGKPLRVSRAKLMAIINGEMPPSTPVVEAISSLETLKRAFLPEVMLSPDIALALRIPEEEARAMIRAVEFGRFFEIGSQVGILRESFLLALRRKVKGARR